MLLFKRSGRIKEKKVFDDYYSSLYLFSLNLISSESMAQVVMLETFEKWKLMDTKRWKLGKIQRTLYRLVFDACVGQVNGLGIQGTDRPSFLGLTDHEKEELIDKEMISGRVFAELHREIESLPIDYRTVFKLAYFEKMDAVQIGRRLGVSSLMVLDMRDKIVKLLRSPVLKKAIMQMTQVVLLVRCLN